MLRRLDGVLRRTCAEAHVSGGKGAGARVWGGTFHATATRLLRLHGRSLGLQPSFTILDRGDAEDLLGLLRSELGLHRRERRFPLKGTCLDIYSRCVNARESVEEAVAAHFPWCRTRSTTCVACSPPM